MDELNCQRISSVFRAWAGATHHTMHVTLRALCSLAGFVVWEK